MSTHEWDTVIVGGGVAGLSAAQMLGRARRRTLVIDSGSPRNRFAAHMHGVLGHDGIDPIELLRRGIAEARSYGVEVRTGAVNRVVDDGVLRVSLTDAVTLSTRSLLIASGVVDDLPPAEGLARLWGSRVLHCPYCHGWEVRDQRIGVIATSPLSAHQIELVRQWTPHLTAFTADLGELDALTRSRWAARGILLSPSPVIRVDEADAGALLVASADGSVTEVDALFTAPNPRIPLDAFADLDLRRADGPGAPLAVDAMGATSHPRVWAAGNVVAPFASVPMAMGAGAAAGAAVNAALVMGDGVVP